MIEKKKPNERKFLNGYDLGKSQCSSRPREKDVALIETCWDNNLDKSWSCKEEKVEHLWSKTLSTGTGKQEDVYWPETEGKSLSTTWIVSAETSRPRRCSFPSHIVQLPPLTPLPFPAFCYHLDVYLFFCKGLDQGKQRACKSGCPNVAFWCLEHRDTLLKFMVSKEDWEREKFMLGKCDCHLSLSPSFVMENRHFTNTYTQSTAWNRLWTRAL